MKWKLELRVLGSMLRSDGNTWDDLDHMQIQADKCWYKLALDLCDKAAARSKKFRAWQAGPEASFIFNSCMWALCWDTLRKARTWENKRCSQMLRLRRRPEEGYKMHKQRVSHTIDLISRSLGFSRIEEVLLQRLWRWAATICKASQWWLMPIVALMRERDDGWWEWQKLVDTACRREERQTRRGTFARWEALFSSTWGVEWRCRLGQILQRQPEVQKCKRRIDSQHSLAYAPSHPCLRKQQRADRAAGAATTCTGHETERAGQYQRRGGQAAVGEDKFRRWSLYVCRQSSSE